MAEIDWDSGHDSFQIKVTKGEMEQFLHEEAEKVRVEVERVMHEALFTGVYMPPPKYEYPRWYERLHKVIWFFLFPAYDVLNSVIEFDHWLKEKVRKEVKDAAADTKAERG